MCVVNRSNCELCIHVRGLWIQQLVYFDYVCITVLRQKREVSWYELNMLYTNMLYMLYMLNTVIQL